MTDYDFQGKYSLRACWIAQDINLYLALGNLAAPALDWDGWGTIASTAATQLQPWPTKPSADTPSPPASTERPGQPRAKRQPGITTEPAGLDEQHQSAHDLERPLGHCKVSKIAF
jgi:hypothetical protein